MCHAPCHRSGSAADGARGLRSCRTARSSRLETTPAQQMIALYRDEYAPWVSNPAPARESEVVVCGNGRGGSANRIPLPDERAAPDWARTATGDLQSANGVLASIEQGCGAAKWHARLSIQKALPTMPIGTLGSRSNRLRCVALVTVGPVLFHALRHPGLVPVSTGRQGESVEILGLRPGHRGCRNRSGMMFHVRLDRS
jgi:hypothetical protein